MCCLILLFFFYPFLNTLFMASIHLFIHLMSPCYFIEKLRCILLFSHGVTRRDFIVIEWRNLKSILEWWWVKNDRYICFLFEAIISFITRYSFLMNFVLVCASVIFLFPPFDLLVLHKLVLLTFWTLLKCVGMNLVHITCNCNPLPSAWNCVRY